MMMPSPLPKVGIVGGAGPMAGLLLCQKIISLCQQKYGCQRDADFPYLMLLSYPFADMLKIESASEQKLIIQQLNECFETFASKGFQLGAIACNTLHAFLGSPPSIRVVNMIEQISQALEQRKINFSLVLCSRTSVKSQLHQSYFQCLYPANEWQLEIDFLIDRIVAGQETQQDVDQLILAIRNFYSNLSICGKEPLGIVLGCTEFSVLNEKWPLADFGLNEQLIVIDSTQVLAEEICQLIFDQTNKNKY